MKPWRPLLVWLLLVIASATAASADRAAEDIDCTQPGGPIARDLCDSDRLDEADARLNATYAEVRAQLQAQATDGSCSQCAAAGQALAEAQRAWIALRDADCAAVHAFNADGTSRNPARMHCLLTHTQDRSRQLRDFYELL